jgi:hypothetical protein
LLLVLLCAAAMGWFAATYLQPYRSEAALRDRLTRLGGGVSYGPREPHWLWRVFGQGIARKTTSLMLSEIEIDDADLAHIGKLSGLEALYLKRTNVTDAGLAHIRCFDQLVALDLSHLPISHPPISRMSKLIELDLSYTDVCEVNTRAMTSLQFLDLRATRITDETLASLAALPKLKTLGIAGAPGRPMSITDRGISSLTRQKFPKLTRIYLYETRVTQEALRYLKLEFPGAAIYQNAKDKLGAAAEAVRPLTAEASDLQ